MVVITQGPVGLSIELGVISLLVVRAYARQQLTLGGIVAALLTGIVHAIHPWSVFFTILIAFFVAGNLATKSRHAYKATLTTSSAGNVSSAPHPRTAVQVFCNSGPATIAIALHWIFLDTKVHEAPTFLTASGTSVCLPHPRSTPQSYLGPPSIVTALPYAIFAFYAAVCADTFASELGISSPSPPRLITAPWRTVPRGTNGGISLAGVLASVLGAVVVALPVLTVTPFCRAMEGSAAKRVQGQTELRTAFMHGYTAEGAEGGKRQWLFPESVRLAGLIVVAGVLGGLLDSLLGAWLQASVVDMHTGKIVEGEGGARVHYSPAHPGGAKIKEKSDGKGGRRLLVGRDVLSNNGVNLAMSTITAFVTLVIVSLYMGITVPSLIEEAKRAYELVMLYYYDKTA